MAVGGLKGIVPDFFILGAPKCGTTALADYLAGHPRVYMSPVKEPQFFCSDFPRLGVFQSTEEYLRLFADAGDAEAVGEASTHYLVSRVAASNILAFNPRARMIAMFRNPVEMVQSYHSQLVFMLLEPVADFERAWRLQGERASGGSPVTGEHASEHLYQYGKIASLGAQVRRLLDVVPRDRVHFILHEDFAASPKAVYEGVLEFLGVPTDNRTSFPRVNVNKRHRWQGLSQLVLSPPPALSGVRRMLQRVPGVEKQKYRIGRFVLHKLLARPVARPAVDDTFRRELQDYFRADIELLADAIGRDLEHWKAT